MVKTAAVWNVRDMCRSESMILPTSWVDCARLWRGPPRHPGRAIAARSSIPTWRLVIRECARVLRTGGWLYVEEPDGTFIQWWERLFRWGHPDEMLTLCELNAELAAEGFTIRGKWHFVGFGFYAAEKTR